MTGFRREDIADIYKLSPMQLGMLFQGVLNEGGGEYVVQLLWALEGRLDAAALERAIEDLVARHGVLRTSIHWEGLDEPFQVVHKRGRLPVVHQDWRGLTAKDQEAVLTAFLEVDRQRGFSLTQPPLSRVVVIRLGPRQWRLVWSFHHLVLDGWSMATLSREVLALYGGRAAGRAVPLPPVRPFREYIRWLQRQDLAASEAFWRRRLEAVEEAGTVPGATRESQGAPRFVTLHHVLSPNTRDALEAWARRCRCTLGVVLQAAWGLLLARYGDAERAVFGTVVSGRPADLPGVEAMVGLFLNTLALRIDLPRRAPVRSWLENLQGEFGEMLAHDFTPLAKVQEWSGVPAGQPLFETLFVLENFPTPGTTGPEESGAGSPEEASPLRVQALETRQRTHFPLTLIAVPGEGLTLHLRHDRRRLDGTAAQRLLGQYTEILRGLPQAATVREVPWLSASEAHQCRVEWSDTATPSGEALPVHFHIAQQARRHPGAVALIGEDGEADLTYGQLEARANVLAAELLRRGVAPDSRVGVCQRRSPAMIVTLLAILKAGAAYVPLDPSYPVARLRGMLEDAAVRVLATEAAVLIGDLADLADPGPGTHPGVPPLQVLNLTDEGKGEVGPTEAPPVPVHPDNIAYTIFTSGSTGRPKAVLVTHRAVTNRMRWLSRKVEMGPGVRVLHKTPIGFDVSVWEIFATLAVGATVVVARPDGHQDPAYLVDVLRRQRVNVTHFVPSMLRFFLQEPDIETCADLRWVVASGEALPADQVALFYRRLVGVGFLNMYGPSEGATATCTINRRDDRCAIAPIGGPIANARAHVLDSHLALLPVTAAGELFLGTVANTTLARGYLGRPALTAERFLPDPFAITPGSRLYRTGDQVRWLSDGRIEYLGRLDFQIKLHGVRIEPEEIAVVLRRHPSVAAAAVALRAVQGVDRLVAYVVPRGPDRDGEALQHFLAETLPSLMVPRAVVFLDDLPRTGSGKLDHRALPDPESALLPAAHSPSAAPRTDLERRLTEIWGTVLKAEAVGVHDNFFALGGDSILSLGVVSRARAAGLGLSPRQLFDHPTIAELAAVLEGEPQREAIQEERSGALRSLVELPEWQRRKLAAGEAIEDLYPLTSLQAGLLYHSLADPDSGVYSSQLACRLRGELDASAFRAAWDRLLARHASLRVRLAWEGLEEPLQLVCRKVPLPWSYLDWSVLSTGEQDRQLAALLVADRRRGFDLRRGPLLRLVLIHLGGNRHAFVWNHHQLLYDGWSVPILLRELLIFYGAGRRRETVSLDPPPLYRDYIAWLQQRDPAVAESFWRRALAGFAEATPLGIDHGIEGGRVRPEDRHEHLLRLTEGETTALQQAAQHARITLNTLVQGAWALLLQRYSGRSDVLFGATVSGRPAELPGADRMVGLFINSLPVRVRFEEGLDLGEWLRGLQLRQAEARQFESTPLVSIQQWSDIPVGTPLFESLVVFENIPLEAPSDGGEPEPDRSLQVERFEGVEQTHFPLLLMVLPGPGLGFRLIYDAGRVESTAVRRRLGHLHRLLQGLVRGLAEPEARSRGPRALAFLAPAERHQLLVEWAVAADVPGGGLVPTRILAQAVQTPDLLALRGVGGEIRYHALVLRSAVLAARLAALGVGPEARVAVCLERSVEVVVAALAVWRAGGVYVPLDPTQPPERLAWMVADCGAVAVLGRPAALSHGPENGSEPLWRLPWVEPAAEDGEPVTDSGSTNLSLHPANAAYVLYTSGSTGRPKAVVVEHRHLAAYLEAIRHRLTVPNGLTYTLVQPFTVDASMTTVLLSLTTGGTLDVLAEEAATDPLVVAERAATANWLKLAPSHLAALLTGAPAQRLLASGGWLVLGGEAAPGRLVAEVSMAVPGLRMVNQYGPTETTVGATVEVTSTPWRGRTDRPMPLGRPLPGVVVRVLDGRGRPVPQGVTGELFLGGRGVTRGYLGRPGLTAERFLPDSWSAKTGARLYRTGDLARFLADGRLEFVGRTDHQIKVRGFRVEPGEVEALLRRHPGVGEVAVTMVGSAGEERLVAYLVAAPVQIIDIVELRTLCQAHLPRPMVPSAFLFLEALPRSVHGKLDRRALPDPAGGSERVRGSEGLRSPVEAMMAELWTEVLGIESIEPDDDFFDLGGHSLLATQLISRVRAVFGADLPIRSLFEFPTLAGLTEVAVHSTDCGGTEPIPLAPRESFPQDSLPLSFAQQRLWLIDRLQQGQVRYGIPAALELRGTLAVAALEAAWQGVIRRHETLRTTFPAASSEAGGEAVQAIAPPSVAQGWSLPVVDLTGLVEGAATLTRQLLAQGAVQPFDLEQGPLLRVVLFRHSGHRHTLAATLHHIISDAWSTAVLVRELVALYQAHQEATSGAPEPLPELPIQYADYALWQRRLQAQGELDRQLVYWRELLAGLPTTLELPIDRPRPSRLRFTGAAVQRTLDQEPVRSLHRFNRSHGSTLFISLLAAFGALLGRLAGQPRLIVGTPIAGRHRQEVEPLIGFFVNTLALPVELRDRDAFPALVARVREAALGAYAHQDLPFERLVEALVPERDLSRVPLVQVVLAVDNTPRQTVELPDLELVPAAVGVVEAKFDLTLGVRESRRGLDLELIYNPDLFDRTRMDRLLRQLEQLLTGAVLHPESPVGRLGLLHPAEAHQLRLEWNDTAVSQPDWATIPALLAQRAAEHPSAPAVRGGGEALSYGDLWSRARRLASSLRSRGVGSSGGDDAVGLCMERSVNQVVALVGILEAGGAYLPLDPTYPSARLEYLLQDGAPRLVLATAATAAGLPETEIPVWTDWESVLDGPGGEGEEDVPRSRSPALGSSLAYIAYTSGSTGEPKGVRVPHQAVVRLVRGSEFVSLGPEEVFLQLAPLSFDAATLELWGPLLNGGRLEVAPPGRLSLEALGRTIEASGVTTLWLTAGLFHSLVDAVPACLSGVRQLLAGGDVLSVPHVRRLLAAHPALRLINGYGPTENTTFTCCYTIDPEAFQGSVPIGRPITGTTVYILDRLLELCPVGVVGELYTGGLGLARDYAGRPGATAERFVPDGLSGTPGARLYGTGDLARFLGDGRVEFLGRRDHQVKVRGYRIELGEVESALVSHAGVAAAVVVAQHRDAGDQRLVAYVVPETGEELPADLRSYLGERLPEYMVPSLLVPLVSLPLNANGKVDRRALPDPEDGLGLGGEGPEGLPEGPVAELLAGAWRRLLGVEGLSSRSDFFELGGHSLLATQLVSRIRELLQVEIPLRLVFEHPTLAAQAVAVGAAVRADQEAPSPIVPVSREALWEDALPASFAQQRLWFLDRLVPGNATYNVPAAVRTRGPLDPRALTGALGQIHARHEVLRTTFRERGGRVWQHIAPAMAPSLPVVDLTGLEEVSAEAVLMALAAREARRPFDLAAGPLSRARLVRRGARDHALLVTFHHIVSDGWSMGVFAAELSALYAAQLDGRFSPLPPLPIQYGDFAVWQRHQLNGKVLERQLNYWRQALDGIPASLDLPFDRPRPAVQTFTGASVVTTLSKTLGDRLKHRAQAEGATLFMVLLTAFDVVLYRLSGQRRPVIGTPIAGRTQEALEGLIGFFVNTLAVAVECEDRCSLGDLLGAVRHATLGAFAHQDLPFERLVEALVPERDAGRHPLFQVVLALQNAPPVRLRLPRIAVTPLTTETEVAKFDLTLFATDRGGVLGVSCNYNRDLFDRTTIDRFLKHWRRGLEALADHPEQTLGEVALLGPVERHQLSLEWNEGCFGDPPFAPLHHLIEAQAARHPEAAAVVAMDGEVLSYRDLDRRANAVARFLRIAGLAAETPVGVCMERSSELVVALLGILKAGAVYLPLDPRVPPQRLADMVGQAKAPLLLTQQRLLAAVERWLPSGVRGVTVEGLAKTEGGVAPGVAVMPDRLAYIIFTSGSTGRPKGVMVPHRGLAAVVRMQQKLFGLRPGHRVLQFSSIGFDASMLEFLAALPVGATLCFGGESLTLLGAELGEFLHRREIHHVLLPPSALGTVPFRQLPVLEAITVGGEACPAELVERWAGERPFFNLYGPTETTIWATVERCRPGTGRPSIGRPLDHTRVDVVDGHLRPVPIGVTGEVVIAGVGVARGYIGRPAWTAERFVPDPRGGIPGARLYRTGDLARRRIDGRLDFLGRRDHQVKLRGFRIELGEIEAALGSAPGVGEAVVLLHRNLAGDPQLIAYLVPEDQGALPPVATLRRHLLQRVPEYMVPTAFIPLVAIPLTTSGKVDRGALPPPGRDSLGATEATSPRDRLELEILEVWRELLPDRALGVTDNFFEVGGHSLLAVTLLARLRERFNRELPLRTLFAGGTVEALAGLLRNGGGGTTGCAVAIRRGEGAAPLFLVHPVGGGVLCYADLARHLGGAWPGAIYGLESVGLESDEGQVDEKIEVMARRYRQEMAAIQPTGALVLGGWSMGGVVAFEMARQLREDGRQVAALMLLDPSPAGHIPSLDETGLFAAWLRDLQGFFPAAQSLASELLDLRGDVRWQRLRELAIAAGAMPSGLGEAHLRRLYRVFRANTRALQQYQPPRYGGPVNLFLPGAGAADRRRWPLNQPGLTVQRVEGDHYSMLRPPRVSGLTDAIRRVLPRSAEDGWIIAELVEG
jgi:amino acid adenylation domain-containing protein